MDMLNYKNKICIVTGAASGIGLATTKLLKECDAKVYALDRNEVTIKDVEYIKCDLNDKNSIDNAFKKIPKNIDSFFGVAGLSGALTDYYTTFTVNYIANKYITEEYLEKRMKKDSSIVYVTSTAGTYWDKYASEYKEMTNAKTWDEMQKVLKKYADQETVGLMAYPLSKRALNHYMAQKSIELGPKGIRVNALLPASTETGMKREFEVEAGGEDELISQTGIANRLATTEEMAKPLLFLNSDMASFISGIALTVDYCNDALIKTGKKRDRLDMKVRNKLFNLGFVQEIMKKQLEPLQNETAKKEEEEII